MCKFIWTMNALKNAIHTSYAIVVVTFESILF